MSEAGLELIADMGAQDLKGLFADRSDDLKPVEAEHVVIAAGA